MRLDGRFALKNAQCIMHNLAARGCFINLTKLHLTLSQSQLTLEYLGCAWVVFSDYYGQKEMFSLDAGY